uniref:DUF674 domain-containing protein n=1 Tax=Kalanchoe fedtschenkoi TaxID=63787 RepID=A0A7N0V5T3_KALFE
MASASSNLNLSLKLLIDTKSSKVLFAEADKAFVDFLFSILALSVGAVTSLLEKNKGMVGSIGVLYESMEGLGDSYIESLQSKEAVLYPKVTLPSSGIHLPLLEHDREAYAPKTFYKCNRDLIETQSRCPSCYFQTIPVTYLDPSSARTTARSATAGFVKGVVTYMVMDDLAVKPMSTISSITLLNTFNIKDVGVLEEKTVTLGMPEGLKLLRASLHSKTVLTEVFLHEMDA